MNVKRPRRIQDENEDDLMEFQEEFLRQKQTSSVKLVKKKHENQQEINNPIPDIVEKKQFKVSDFENIDETAICVLSDLIVSYKLVKKNNVIKLTYYLD
jgi:hypothetical protein